MKGITSLLRQLKKNPFRSATARTNRVRMRCRPFLDVLEDRVAPANVSLTIPSNLNVVQGGVVAVPVQFAALADGLGDTGMSQADLAINYDPSVVSVSGSDVHQGTALVAVASLMTISSSFAPGQLQLSITSPMSPIASVSGPGGSQPITVTTMNPLPAGLNYLDTVTISGVTGFAAANGTFGIAVTGSNTFTLNNTTGDVGSGSGGNWGPIIGSQGATNDSLVVIDFHASASAALGTSAISLVSSNSLGSTDLFAGTAPQNQYGLTLTSGSVNVLPAAAAPALGYFAPVTNISTIGASNGIGTMLLLTDGSIMVDVGGDGDANNWYRLTPDSSGNYADGTWHNLASSNIGRLFFGSVVLQNGDVMVLGGEDTNIGGNIASVVGSGSGPITVTTQNPLPTDLMSGSVSIKGVTGFPSTPNFNINGGFNFTVTGSNTFTLAGTNGISGSSNSNTGSFSVSETNAGEIFTPPTTPGGMGSWQNITPFPAPTFGDSSLELLSDGTVLAGPNSSNASYRYNPALDPILNPSLPASDNPWSLDAAQSPAPTNTGGSLAVTNAETGWTKLGDGSILTYQLFAFTGFGIGGGLISPAASPQTGARFILGATQAQDQWVNAGNVPVPLGATGGASVIQEMGPSFLLPDGRVFAVGANGNTALYTPPALAGNSTGTWVAGPVIPNGEAATDAPGAVMTNGDVLFAVSPYMTNGSGNGDSGHLFNTPTQIDEYNPTTNTITVVPLNDVTNTPIPDLVNTLNNESVFVTRMLDLPNGQVLISDSSGVAYVYTPNASPNGIATPLSAWQPVINSFKENGDGSFTLTGTQITGISEGATYGDDAQMASNYPIVELTDGGGNVFFATTTNWSSANVQTGSTPETVQFTLPSGTTLSDFTSVTVIANGIASLSVPALASPNVMPPANQSSVEGATQTFGLGSFIDPSGSSWTVDVNWGDGTPDTIFTTATTGSLGTANHTYGEEGSYNPTVTVTDTTNNLSGSAGFQVSVSDPAVLGTGVAVSAVEGAPFTGTEIAFTDPGGAEPNPSDPSGTINNHYQVVSIDWGDNTPLDTTTGTISYSGSQGSTTAPFTVSGNHTYVEEGTYTITVIIDHEGIDTTIMTTATVSDPAVVLAGGFTFNELEGSPATSQTVATFTDPGGPENDGLADTYVATVHWSDGTPDDTETLANGGIVLGADGKTFYINLTHSSPAEDGSYSVAITVNHEGVLSGPATSTLVIKDNIGILLLDPSGKNALQDSGNGQVTVTGLYGGAILVNSTSYQSATASGNASVSASEVDVGGAPGTQTSGHGLFNTPEINVNEAPYADPLASLTLPTPSASPFPAANISGKTSVALPSGTYLGGINISGQASVTLSGTYILEGGGFNVSGKASVTGQQVMLFNAPNKQGDAIQVTGQATLSLSAPINGVYKGIAILQSRIANAPTLQFSGQANVQITGMIYAATALTQVSGSAVLHLQGNAANQMGAHLIVSDLQVSGNGVVTVDASFNNLALFDPPPPPNTPNGDTLLSLAQVTSLVGANLPSLVNVSYVAFANDNPNGTSITPAAVQALALKLIQAELPSAAITDLTQLADFELSVIDQAFAMLE